MGDHIMLNDGYQELKFVEFGDGFIEASVVQGGKITSHKGSTSGVNLNIPAFTEKDREGPSIGLSQGGMQLRCHSCAQRKILDRPKSYAKLTPARRHAHHRQT
jgi:pyruvate kinase